ncbi:unnamed protein product [Darwinula stevensoni]|uniref:Transmembrane protein 45B n=1 Tax=Darwinula stevensoni TaxID=69355 RepID=A0A7R8XG63_9CRUS|nr:unnamed protein product [Darwinula stevensoni]CAG0891362.1 unnamed protein product [Darwinula stevensoni]
MGNLAGHSISAVSLLLWSLWVIWNNLVRWHRSRFDPSSPPFRAGMRFPIRGRHGVDAGFICFCCLVGISVECGNALDKNWNWMYPENSQHIAIYFAFFLYFLIGTLVDKGYPILPYADDIFGIFALVVEWLLFAYHTHGKLPFEVVVHTLLGDVIKGGILLELLMIWKKSNIIPVLGFAYTLLFQATWFFQIGLFLHWRNTWDFESHVNMTYATVIFIAHLFLDAIFVLALSSFIEKSVRGGGCLTNCSEEKRILLSQDEKEERDDFKKGRIP